MKITILLLCLISHLISTESFGFNHFSRTNGGNITLPATLSQTAQFGWFKTERADGHPCREGLGVEYTEGSPVQTKERPLSLFYNAAGEISAFVVRAWFTNASHYNRDIWLAPVFGGTEGERWIVVSLRDPEKACVKAEVDGMLLGDRILINSIGYEMFKVPLIAPQESGDHGFYFGACQLGMSRHWGYPLSGDSHDLFGYDHGIHVLPVVPMYSVPEIGEGGLTALAFFTTEEQITQRYGGIWDATGTAADLCSGNFCLDADSCVYGERNSVLHIFFIQPGDPRAQCGRGGVPDCRQ